MILTGNEIVIYLWGVFSGFGLMFLGVIAGVLFHGRMTRKNGLDKPVAKNGRTHRDKRRDERKLESHFSVINVESEAEEIAKHLEEDDVPDPEEGYEFSGENLGDGDSGGGTIEQATTKSNESFQEATSSSPASTVAGVAEEKPKRIKCSAPDCNYQAKWNPAPDGKFYCGRHWPQGG